MIQWRANRGYPDQDRRTAQASEKYECCDFDISRHIYKPRAGEETR